MLCSPGIYNIFLALNLAMLATRPRRPRFFHSMAILFKDRLVAVWLSAQARLRGINNAKFQIPVVYHCLFIYLLIQ